MLASKLITSIQQGNLDENFLQLYVDPAQIPAQQVRWIGTIERFISLFGDKDVQLFSAAGRTEVSGNHTDHQHGRVLAASVNLDSIAVAAATDNDTITVVSDDYTIDPVRLDDLAIREAEFGTSQALIRGIAAALKEEGYNIGGFEACCTSSVLAGAGLSSSASFEILIAQILSGLYNEDRLDLVEAAKAGQKAENVYFGKPCGLMDQCACAVGGLITIDFKDPSAPQVRPVDVDFSRFGQALCILDTKGSHADLTGEYAAVPGEMRKVASLFGREVLREVEPQLFFENIAKVREACGDRACLRALHFFNENARVKEIVEALEADDFAGFKKGITESGDSSYKYLQNVNVSGDPENEALGVALALSEQILGDKGFCRVHGGGFAGTVQAFVDEDFVPVYKEKIEQIFGPDSCHVLRIRPAGGIHIPTE